MADTFSGLWQAWSHTIQAAYIDSEGKGQISENGKSFAKFAKLYRDKGYVTNARPWTDEWYQIGQNNATMGYFCSSWFLVPNAILSAAEGDEDGPAYGKYRITQGPAKWHWGGLWAAVSTHCNNREIAHDFIYDFVVNPETALQFMKENTDGSLVNNADAVSKYNAESGYENPLLGGQSQYPVLLDNMKDYDLPAQPQPYDVFLNDLYYDAVIQYANGGFDSLESMEESFRADVENMLS